MNDKCPIEIVTSPGEEFSTKYRFWQGCPTIQVTPGGRLWAGWYSGGTIEPSTRNYNLLVKSDDGGLSWSEPELVILSNKEAMILAIDIQLWMDPDNQMWVFWVQRDFHFEKKDTSHLSTWAVTCDNPDADQPVWSEPRFVAPGFLRCRPTVLSDGRYMLCSYDWAYDCYSYSESSDKGVTWERRHGGKKIQTDFDESMIFEQNDGILRLLARSQKYFLAESYSYDGGKSWTDGSLSNIVSCATRFFIRRLPSGKVLLVHNNCPDKRINMTVALSEDDGKSWQHLLLLDSAEFSGNISYPDVSWDNDGNIYIVHDNGRNTFKEILLSKVTEEDIMVGKLVNHGSFLKNIISKAPGKPYDQSVYDQMKAEEDEFFGSIGWR